jgi:hypothetical protein
MATVLPSLHPLLHREITADRPQKKKDMKISSRTISLSSSGAQFLVVNAAPELEALPSDVLLIIFSMLAVPDVLTTARGTVNY